MFLLILVVVSLTIAWKYGDWRHWELYYSTSLYWIIGDITCSYLTYNMPLWSYHSAYLSHTFIDLLITVAVYPCSVLVFIPYYPENGFSKKMGYLLLWVFAYSGVEWLAYHLGYFSYHNGWNIYLTIGFNCVMLSLLRLHFKNPLLVWIPSMAFAFLTIFIFKIPFSSMR